ncbi:UPF0280 family protein [bacterium]|nr:MAG: UPF0280 family protein [bacterium]
MYVDRFYRDESGSNDLASFRVAVRETDLYIGVLPGVYSKELEQQVETLVWQLRRELEEYIKQDPVFKTTLVPHLLQPGAPPVALMMTRAANQCGVGPMAAVAGAYAETVGRELLKVSPEVIVENGGDIFLASRKKRLVGVFAGTSPFSGKLALELETSKNPLGICTSSGTVGPSFSFGRADAAIIVAENTALADAAASAAGNAVTTVDDIPKGIEAVNGIRGVYGVLIIKDDKMGAWGDIKLAPVKKKKG